LRWFREAEPASEANPARRRLAFAETGAMRSFEHFPTEGDYEKLLPAYRAWAG
jgi:hypothetical protein